MFKKIKCLNDVKLSTEGKLLIMALSILSKYQDTKEPNEILATVVKLAEEVYKKKQQNER